MKLLKFLSITAISASILIPTAFVDIAEAVPSFARENGLGCASCHSNWPRLTKMGRDFKENGYKLGDEAGASVSDYLKLDKTIPVSGRMNMRLIDKRQSKSSNNDLKKKDTILKMRALHEVELFLAGNASDKVSFFAEFEAEDEWPIVKDSDIIKNDLGQTNNDTDLAKAPGFQVQLAMGHIIYNINDAANLWFGLGSPLAADGYNTVNTAKNVRQDWAVSSKGFLPGRDSQYISVAGRPIDQLSYILAWSANGGNSKDTLVGKDPRDLTGRVAFDVTDEIMIGGYFQSAKEFNGSESEETNTKYGIDFQADMAGFGVDAVFASKDMNGDADTHTAISLSVQHFIKAGDFLDGSCKLVVSKYDTEDSSADTDTDSDDYGEAGLFFTKFIGGDNIKAQLGWEGQWDTPQINHESRFTLVFDIGL